MLRLVHRLKGAEGAALLTALLSVVVYFFPALSKGGWETDYTMVGDGLHSTAAGFLIAKHYFMNGIFTGVDFFTHGGGSEYFLRPNYPVYYPPLLLLSPLIDPRIPQTMTGFFVGLQCIHAFVSIFFCHRLCVRFFKFDGWLAAFVAVSFALSPLMTRGLWFLPLVTCAWLLPVCIYAALSYAERPRWTGLILASVPVFLVYTAGYFPAAIAAIVLSGGFVLAWSMRGRRIHSWRDVGGVLRCLMPALLATLIVLPYYLAAMQFHQHVEIRAWDYSSSLRPIVHDLSEHARFLLRGLLYTLNFPGLSYEFSIYWGLVPLLIAILYFFWLPAPRELAQAARRRGVDQSLMIACAVTYVFFMLIIFGLDSPLAISFYYFVPVLGKMHVYQRYLVFAHFFFAVAVALMLHFVAQDQRRGAVKLLLLVMGVLTAVTTQYVGQAVGATSVIGNNVVVELLLAVLFLLAMLVLPRRGIVGAALILTFMVSLGAMYRYTNGDHERNQAIHARTMAINPSAINAFGGWLRAHSAKPIVKYVDLTPGFHNYVSKNLPWFLLDDVKMAGYYGYETHLGAEWGMRKMMSVTRVDGNPDLVMRPDWEWLRKTGAEFVLFEEGHPGNDPKIKDYADMSEGKPYRFQGMNGNNKDENIPAHYVVAPLKFLPPEGEAVRFDNAYFRVQSAGDVTVGGFETNNANRLSLRLEGAQPATVQYLFWPGRHLRVELDGKRVEYALRDGLMTVTVPPGKHELRIVYRNTLLSVFVALYAFYAMALLGTLGFLGYRLLRRLPKARLLLPARR